MLKICCIRCRSPIISTPRSSAACTDFSLRALPTCAHGRGRPVQCRAHATAFCRIVPAAAPSLDVMSTATASEAGERGSPLDGRGCTAVPPTARVYPASTFPFLPLLLSPLHACMPPNRSPHRHSHQKRQRSNGRTLSVYQPGKWEVGSG